MNLLVTNPTNIRYLTGFTPIDRGDAWTVITGTKKYLITNSIYTEEAKQLQDIDVIESTNFTQSVQNLGFKTVEFEANDLTVAEYNKFTIKLIPTTGKIEKLREIKGAAEIQMIRLASSITKQCFRFIERRVRPGMTEARLANEIEGYFRYKGAGSAFSPIVAFNEHSSQPHYRLRGNSPLRRDSLVLLDFGAKVSGYCADMTRVIFVGKPRPEWVRAYTAVDEAQRKAIELIRNGERNGATLDAAAKEVIAEVGLPPYQHSLGHNIGLDVHESPRLTVKKPALLRPGMIFSVEPGTYTEGKYGIRREDLVLLKKDGIEILT